MEFRLVLRGALPPHKRGTVPEKKRFGRSFILSCGQSGNNTPRLKTALPRKHRGARPLIQQHADEYTRCGSRFVPLVVEDVACALDILILRRDDPYRLLGGPR